MMRWTKGMAAAGALALMAGAWPAAAQEADTDAASLIAEMNAKLMPLAEAAGLSPAEAISLFDPLIRTAVPVRPDDGKTWGFQMEFDSHQTIQEPGAPLAAHTGGWTQLATGAECSQAFNGGEVVSFRRIAVGTLRGFQCVQVSHDNGAGGMISHTLIEGADRRFEATYQTAVVVADAPDETRLLTERMVEQNLALATEITAVGLRGLERARYQP